MSKNSSKLIILSVSLLVIITLLSACAPKPESSVESLFSAMKEFNIEKIQDLIDPDTKTDGNNQTLENYTDEDDEYLKHLLEYFKEKSSKIEYQVKDSKVDGNNATVDVHVKYVDGGGLISNVFSKFLEEAITMAFTDADMSEERSEEVFFSILNSEIDKSEDRFVDKDLKIDLIKKDNKWYLTELSDEILDVMLTNFNSVFKAFDEEDENGSLEDEETVEITMDDEFQLETINLKVNKIDKTKELVQTIDNSKTPAKKGSSFIILDVDVKNITKEPLDLSSGGMILKDGEDRLFDEYEDSIWDVDNHIDMRKIGPGITENGLLVYEVPEDAENFSLLMRSGLDEALYEMKLK